MRNLIFVAIILSTISSCGSEQRPDDIYSMEKMKNVLTEIHLVDRALNAARVRMDTATVLYHKHYLPKICKKHDVTPEGIERSLEYYIKRVDEGQEFQEIYDMVTDSLNKLEIIRK